MKIYYAHHMYKYNTKVEEYELSLIKKTFPKGTVINPNGFFSFSPQESEESIMQSCLETIHKSDALVFSSMSGVVGVGVFTEVNFAISLKKPVYYIQNNKITKCSQVMFQITDEGDRVYAIIKKII